MKSFSYRSLRAGISQELVQQRLQHVSVQLPLSEFSNVTHSCLFYRSHRFGKRLGYRKEETYSKRQRKEPSPEEESKPQFGANNYSNDGSFLEKFYKMQGMKGKTRCKGGVATVLNSRMVSSEVSECMRLHFILQQMVCIGFNVTVHMIRLRQQH